MGNSNIVNTAVIDATKTDYVFWSINIAKTLGYVSIWLSRFGYKVSPTAVNKHLHNLKNIFGVDSNEALRDMSLKLGYDVAIPAGFIPLGSWNISDDVFDLWLC